MPPGGGTSTTSRGRLCCAAGSTPTVWRPKGTTAPSRARSRIRRSAAFDTACEIANILGLGHIGTGSDPTGSAYVADWALAAERWNILGQRAASHGLKLYTHNHDIAYSFLLDSGPLDDLGRPTRSSGVRRLEYFLANTDPAYVYLEMDIYWAHVAQYKHHTYIAPDGTSVQDIFDPAAVVAAQTTRFPFFHAKDGRRDDDRGQRLCHDAVR